MKTKVGNEAADENVFTRNKATNDNTTIDVANEDIVAVLEDDEVGNNYVAVGGNDNDDGGGGGISDIPIPIAKWWSTLATQCVIIVFIVILNFPEGNVSLLGQIN